MAKFKSGDMWSVFDSVDLFCITTNSYIKNNGALVMGRGIAKQAMDRFPGLDLSLGKAVALNQSYFLLVSPRWPNAKLACFQVKFHFRSNAKLELIQCSADALSEWCSNHPESSVALNYPGIGYGHLTRVQVSPIISELPDSVTIWLYPGSSLN